MDPSSSTMMMSESGQQGSQNMMNAPAEQLLAVTSMPIKCTNSVRLSSSQVPRGYLGGLPHDDDDGGTSANKIPVDTVYGSLPRGPMSSLPGMHSGSSSKTFASKELQDAFLKIYKGDFFMEWSEKANDQEDDTEEKQTLTVVVTLPNDHANDNDDEAAAAAASTSSSSSSSPRLFRGALLCVIFTATPTSRFRVLMCPITSPSAAGDNGSGQLFIDSLTINQREALSYRILHIFVRTRGAMTHETTCRGLIKFLRILYDQKRSYWKESVDVAMIAADIEFNTPPWCRNNKYILADLDRVAAALEADGRFHEAATLYEEISAKFFSKYPSTNSTYDQARFYNNAGIAYMRAENFAGAERTLVFALHHTLAGTGGSWSLTDPKTKNFFCNMIAIYPHWEATECRDGRGGVATEEFDATVETALRILTRTSGIYRDKADDGLDVSMLKPKYMRKKVAQKTLALAFGSPVSVDKYRQTILECVHVNCIVTSQGVSAAASTADVRRTHKQAARAENASRTSTTGMSSDDQRITMNCNNPNCRKANDEAKFLFCPCHTVCYCQKDCQRAHWKEHKKVCPKQERTSS